MQYVPLIARSMQGARFSALLAGLAGGGAAPGEGEGRAEREADGVPSGDRPLTASATGRSLGATARRRPAWSPREAPAEGRAAASVAPARTLSRAGSWARRVVPASREGTRPVSGTARARVTEPEPPRVATRQRGASARGAPISEVAAAPFVPWSVYESAREAMEAEYLVSGVGSLAFGQALAVRRGAELLEANIAQTINNARSRSELDRLSLRVSSALEAFGMGPGAVEVTRSIATARRRRQREVRRRELAGSQGLVLTGVHGTGILVKSTEDLDAAAAEGGGGAGGGGGGGNGDEEDEDEDERDRDVVPTHAEGGARGAANRSKLHAARLAMGGIGVRPAASEASTDGGLGAVKGGVFVTESLDVVPTGGLRLRRAAELIHADDVGAGVMLRGAGVVGATRRLLAGGQVAADDDDAAAAAVGGVASDEWKEAFAESEGEVRVMAIVRFLQAFEHEAGSFQSMAVHAEAALREALALHEPPPDGGVHPFVAALACMLLERIEPLLATAIAADPRMGAAPDVARAVRRLRETIVAGVVVSGQGTAQLAQGGPSAAGAPDGEDSVLSAAAAAHAAGASDADAAAPPDEDDDASVAAAPPPHAAHVQWGAGGGGGGSGVGATVLGATRVVVGADGLVLETAPFATIERRMKKDVRELQRRVEELRGERDRLAMELSRRRDVVAATMMRWRGGRLAAVFAAWRMAAKAEKQSSVRVERVMTRRTGGDLRRMAELFSRWHASVHRGIADRAAKDLVHDKARRSEAFQRTAEATRAIDVARAATRDARAALSEALLRESFLRTVERDVVVLAVATAGPRRTAALRDLAQALFRVAQRSVSATVNHGLLDARALRLGASGAGDILQAFRPEISVSLRRQNTRALDSPAADGASTGPATPPATPPDVGAEPEGPTTWDQEAASDADTEVALRAADVPIERQARERVAARAEPPLHALDLHVDGVDVQHVEEEGEDDDDDLDDGDAEGDAEGEGEGEGARGGRGGGGLRVDVSEDREMWAMVQWRGVDPTRLHRSALGKASKLQWLGEWAGRWTLDPDALYAEGRERAVVAGGDVATAGAAMLRLVESRWAPAPRALAAGVSQALDAGALSTELLDREGLADYLRETGEDRHALAVASDAGRADAAGASAGAAERRRRGNSRLRLAARLDAFSAALSLTPAPPPAPSAPPPPAHPLEPPLSGPAAHVLRRVREALARVHTFLLPAPPSPERPASPPPPSSPAPAPAPAPPARAASPARPGRAPGSPRGRRGSSGRRAALAEAGRVPELLGRWLGATADQSGSLMVFAGTPEAASGTGGTSTSLRAQVGGVASRSVPGASTASYGGHAPHMLADPMAAVALVLALADGVLERAGAHVLAPTNGSGLRLQSLATHLLRSAVAPSLGRLRWDRPSVLEDGSVVTTMGQLGSALMLHARGPVQGVSVASVAELVAFHTAVVTGSLPPLLGAGGAVDGADAAAQAAPPPQLLSTSLAVIRVAAPPPSHASIVLTPAPDVALRLSLRVKRGAQAAAPASVAAASAVAPQLATVCGQLARAADGAGPVAARALAHLAMETAPMLPRGPRALGLDERSAVLAAVGAWPFPVHLVPAAWAEALAPLPHPTRRGSGVARAVVRAAGWHPVERDSGSSLVELWAPDHFNTSPADGADDRDPVDADDDDASAPAARPAGRRPQSALHAHEGVELAGGALVGVAHGFAVPHEEASSFHALARDALAHERERLLLLPRGLGPRQVLACLDAAPHEAQAAAAAAERALVQQLVAERAWEQGVARSAADVWAGLAAQTKAARQLRFGTRRVGAAAAVPEAFSVEAFARISSSQRVQDLFREAFARNIVTVAEGDAEAELLKISAEEVANLQATLATFAGVLRAIFRAYTAVRGAEWSPMSLPQYRRLLRDAKILERKARRTAWELSWQSSASAALPAAVASELAGSLAGAAGTGFGPSGLTLMQVLNVFHVANRAPGVAPATVLARTRRASLREGARLLGDGPEGADGADAEADVDDDTLSVMHDQMAAASSSGSGSGGGGGVGGVGGSGSSSGSNGHSGGDAPTASGSGEVEEARVQPASVREDGWALEADDDVENPANALTPREFVEAVVRLAWELFAPGRRGKKDGAGGSGGGGAGAAGGGAAGALLREKANLARSMAEAVAPGRQLAVATERLITQHLLKHAHGREPSALRQSALLPEVIAVLEEFELRLWALFTTCCREQWVRWEMSAEEGGGEGADPLAPPPPARPSTSSSADRAPPPAPPRPPRRLGASGMPRFVARVPTMLTRTARRPKVSLPPPPRHALTLSSWTLLLADLGLLGSTGLLLEDASRIFDCAQMPEEDTVVDVDKTFDDTLTSDPDAELNFPEFQEALIAVAVCVARDPSLPLHARIRAVFDLALPAVHAQAPSEE